MLRGRAVGWPPGAGAPGPNGARSTGAPARGGAGREQGGRGGPATTSITVYTVGGRVNDYYILKVTKLLSRDSRQERADGPGRRVSVAACSSGSGDKP
jgi:hypothetical protein